MEGMSASDDSKQGIWRSPGVIAPAVACAVAFAGLYAGVFSHLAYRWSSDGNYSHGFLVPLIAAAFVYTRREALTKLKARPSWTGWAVIAAGLLIYVVGVAKPVFYLEAASILVVLAGVALVLGGRAWLWFFGFPILYLALMIPLPLGVYQALTFKLQLWATRVSAGVLKLVGTPVYADANIITFAGGKSLAIAEACSGLRSILGLLATSLAFVYFLFGEPLWERAVLVASTLPIAMLANVLRISGTGLLYHHVSAHAAEGFFHSVSGWLVFVFALLVLMIEYRIIRWLFDEGGGRGAAVEEGSG